MFFLILRGFDGCLFLEVDVGLRGAIMNLGSAVSC